jgi:PIN domain nuclease of toxin-antitoxin system
MNKCVLDSSALLAFINQEDGYEIVEKYLPTAIMSSVNVAEVAAVLSSVDIPEDIISGIIHDLDIEVVNFDQGQALQTGFLRKKTKSAGLSFGDRACIHLAISKNLPVITGNEIWKNVDVNVEFTMVR